TRKQDERIGNKAKAVIDYITEIKRIEVLSDLTGVKEIKSKTIENIIRLLPKFENELQKLQELENKMKAKVVIDYIVEIKRIEVLSDLMGVKGIK
ncbi:7705_t:CDS:2, partial [Ambispora leptoticha]